MSISSVSAGAGYGRWNLPGDNSNAVLEDSARPAALAPSQATQQVAQLPSTLPSAKDLRVYVVDVFGKPDTSISRSNTNYDMSHGQVVETIIRRGLPDAQITRVDASGATPGSAATIASDGTAAGTLANTLEAIIAQQTQAQAVPRSRIDLQDFVVNMSASDKRPMTAQERARLVPAVAEFTARGGRIYVAAGNQQRNPIIDVPGIIGVDGSDGVIGAAPNRRPSGQFDNGNVPRVANAQFVPLHQADGRIRPFADSPLLLPPGTEAPMPPAPFNGKALADVLVDQKALAEPLRRRSAALAESERLFNRQHLPGVSPAERAALQRRHQAVGEELGRLNAQIARLTDGKVIPVSMANPDGEESSRMMDGREIVPRGIDRNRVYVSSEYLLGGVHGTDIVYYQNVGGVLRPLSGPGFGMASWGTSWATPNFLVEQEVARLQRLNARPAQQ